MATSDVNTLFLAKETAKRVVLVCSDTDIWEFDGQTWRDRTGLNVSDGTKLRWTGGWLTGALTMANRRAVRTFRPGVDTESQPMLYNGGVSQPANETWEAKRYYAHVFRPYLNFMFAGNVNWDSEEYPSRVQWCHPVEPGLVPVDWVPRDDNQAGDVDLADTPGHVVDMLQYREYLMIFKEDGIHLCQFVGGNQIFSFRQITTHRGMYAQDCAVEANGLCWCQGVDDIFTVDGNRAESVVWGRVKKAWLADRDEDKAQYAFTVLDPINEEILFCYPSNNAPAEYLFPDKQLVFSLRNGSFFFRDYGLELPHAKVSLDVERQTSARQVFYGLDRTGGRLLSLEVTPDRMGASVPAYFQRTGLFSDPGHDWVQVDRAKLQVTGNQCTLTLGHQDSVDGVLNWRAPFTVIPGANYKTDARVNGNLVAYRVDFNTLADWQVSNLDLLVQKSGERG